MSKPVNLQAAGRALTGRFRQAGLETPELDARLLVAAACDLNAVQQVSEAYQPLDEAQWQKIYAYQQRRLKGEPIDHILGRREFYGYDFRVSADVLSPRPETETLVRAVLGRMVSGTDWHILDTGTGSGAILISLLCTCARASGVGLDISETALEVARCNAVRLGVTGRIHWMCADWFPPVKQAVFDIIVANPPYISDADMSALAPEVRYFDPPVALRGGKDGLAAYRAILSRVKAYLRPQGRLFLEVGYNQSEAVSMLIIDQGLQIIKRYRDLLNHERVIEAQNF